MEVICFVIGLLFKYTQNLYLGLIVIFFYFISLRARVFLFFILGIVFAGIHQWLISSEGMPDAPLIPHAFVSGFIASIPEQGPHKTRFNFLIEQINGRPAKSLVQLFWYNKAPVVHAGEHWQLEVKLKKPRNFLNPGSFDYAGVLWSRHILFVGYVLNQGKRLKTSKGILFNSLVWRECLSERLKQLSENKQTGAVLQALTLNLTNDIAQEDWELFRRTGTLHLFSISGEHIALIWGMVFFLMKWVWSRSIRLCLFLPASCFASLIGLLAAFSYSILAGFGPPVQRALVACFLYALSSIGKQRFAPWQTWRYALVAVVFLEPHAVFMQGFYFSFLAVSCLLLTSQRWPLKGWKQQLALQCSCLIGLMPLSLYWFSYGSINGFVANAFAIPLMGFLIVPLALTTLTFSSFHFAWIGMKPLGFLVALLFKGLIWTEHLSFINVNTPMPQIELVLAVMGALLLCIVLPIKPFRGIVLLGFLLPFLPKEPFIHKGEALIDVLDVGQGLSVSIRTKHHVLLYDTGDRFFLGNDLGKMVILPFYKRMNVKKIDTLVISHPDRDHRGGLLSVEAGIKLEKLLVNDPRYYHRGQSCHHHPSWEWDGVSFRFFPIQALFKSRNNSSCILQVSTSAGRFLLTGDIEATAEDYLIKQYGAQLKSPFLLIPHHGSKTSSSYRFLMEVAPRYGIVSLGFDNRFHFPHAKTLKNLKRLGVHLYRTDQCGMVEFVLPVTGEIKKPVCFSSILKNKPIG